MATLAFIPYVPKASNAKPVNKLLSKDVLKESRSSNSSQHIEQSAIASRMMLKEDNSLSQRVDDHDGAFIQGMPAHHLATMLRF
jgi:uncharacterized protein (DUF305 family)